MKMLVLQGSPRRKGNTDTLVEAMARGAQAGGARVEKVYLAQKRISGCVECYWCQRHPDKVDCAVQDDGRRVLAKMRRADLIVLATPVFCWGPSAQLKAMLDRTFCTFKFNVEPYRCCLAGKAAALVVTAGGDRNDGADLVVDGVRRWATFSRLKWRGQLLGVSLGEPAATAADKKLLARAERFGRRLASR